MVDPNRLIFHSKNLHMGVFKPHYMAKYLRRKIRYDARVERAQQML